MRWQSVSKHTNAKQWWFFWVCLVFGTLPLQKCSVFLDNWIEFELWYILGNSKSGREWKWWNGVDWVAECAMQTRITWHFGWEEKDSQTAKKKSKFNEKFENKKQHSSQFGSQEWGEWGSKQTVKAWGGMECISLLYLNGNVLWSVQIAVFNRLTSTKHFFATNYINTIISHFKLHFRKRAQMTTQRRACQIKQPSKLRRRRRRRPCAPDVRMPRNAHIAWLVVQNKLCMQNVGWRKEWMNGRNGND